MTNWEFDGFFRIGMHHRNERNAIIQHGTMTLMRKAALVGTGNWSEWCICEDAELGLRLMHAGYETLYVDEEFGRGLTPADFKSFKSQRFRWAFGAMQILKRRWGWLVKRGPLTAGQRFHFLTGWFSWFGDALHFVFTFAALMWTVGMLALPELFTLPVNLFLIPLLGFFIAKAVFGPILYAFACGAARPTRRRGARQHGAVARDRRGVWAGLTQKEGAFVKTAKSWKTRVTSGVFGVVKEEALMLAALMLGILGMAWRDGLNHRETTLWMLILAAQSLPYVSALAVSWISAWSERRQQQPATDAQAAPQVPALPEVACRKARCSPRRRSAAALRQRHVEAGQRQSAQRGRPDLAGADRQRGSERPRRDDLARLHRRECRLSRQQVGEVREREERTVEHVRAAAFVFLHARAAQRDAERRELRGAVGNVLHRHRRPHQQASVQAERGHGVGRAELPARKHRLHDLETVGDPVDRREDRRHVARHRRRAREVQDDLRLDARLGEVGHLQRRGAAVRVRDGRVVDVAQIGA